MKVCLYHKNCQDGLFSAYNLWKVFGSKDTIYIDVNYKPIQDMEAMEALEYIFDSYINSKETINGIKYNFKNDKVTIDDYSDMDLYVVDYSFPVEHFLKHTELFKSILILDHHKTAIDSYLKIFNHYNKNDKNWIIIEPSPNSKIVFSKNESGAKLSYRYFNENKEVPDYIELISDRDLWTFNLKYSKAFYFGCQMFNLDNFNILDQLLKTSLHNITYVGEKYESLYMRRLEKKAKANIIEINVNLNNNTYKCALVNSYLDIASDLCSYIIENENYDMSIAYNIDNNLLVGCSLRSKENLDSSDLSLMFGGGGHERASGFSISLDQFTKIVNDKLIEVTYTKEEE